MCFRKTEDGPPRNKKEREGTMTIKEASEIIEKNPSSFPNGTNTCYGDVLRFKARTEILPEISKLKLASGRFMELAYKLDGVTPAEVNEAFKDMRKAMNKVNNCWNYYFGED